MEKMFGTYSMNAIAISWWMRRVKQNMRKGLAGSREKSCSKWERNRELELGLLYRRDQVPVLCHFDSGLNVFF